MCPAPHTASAAPRLAPLTASAAPRLALFALACGVAGGCAGTPPTAGRQAEVGSVVADLPAGTYTSPARWGYHPVVPDESTAWLPWDGGCVLVAKGGQRWMVTPHAAGAAGAPGGGAAAAGPTCAGRGASGAAPAPEELVDLVRRSSTSWLYVGASGTIYEAAAALGPLMRTVTPPEPLLQIAGGEGVLLAVTRGGQLFRHEERTGWARVTLEPAPPSGPAVARAAPLRVFDIASKGRRALLLALPESLYATDDGGLTWKRSPLPAAGLFRVGVAQGGGLLAEGVLSSIAWDPRATPAFSRSSATLPRAHPELAIEVPRAPTAAAVQVGRAAVTGDRYYEVISPEGTGEPWSLARGTIEGPLSLSHIAGTADCGSMKLGASGKHVVAVCVRPIGDEIAAEVLRSDDAGAHWTSAARLETPDVDRVGIAASPDGAALLTGVCKRSADPEPAAGGVRAPARARSVPAGECRPSAPLLLRLDQGSRERVIARLVRAPTLGNLAVLPAFSTDGRSAYFAGYRAKDERLALFVSHDGGETFSPRPIERERTPPPPLDDDQPIDEDLDVRPDEGDSGGLELTEDSTLRPGEDGTVGLMVAQESTMVYVTADEDGRVIATSPPPVDGALMAAFGRRGLAVAPAAAGRDTGRGEGVRLWETLDGGVSWVELPEMPAVTQDFFRGAGGLACGAGGCLLGDTVTRIGWGGQVETTTRAAAPLPRQFEPSVRVPIVCETVSGSKWTRIDHVDGALPSSNEAMRGRSVWSMLTRDPPGAVSAVSAMLPESGAGEARIVTRVMLRAPPRGARVATNVTTQMEGYAAARVRLSGAPGSKIKLGAPLRDVEIAWENWMDGTSGRGRIADAGPVELGDVKPAAGDAYDPELLSVSVRGMFVRPHSGSAQSALTFFYEPGAPHASLRRFDYPTWPLPTPERRLDVQGDAVIADGRPVGVGMIRLDKGGPITTVLLAHAPAAGAGPWAIDATTVAPPLSRQRDLIMHTDWTYGDSGTIGVTVLAADPRYGRGWATFQAFRGDGTLGPAAPLPTPFDLPDPPRPCAAAQRASTARLEAPMFLRGDVLFAGTRHPVLVTDTPSPGSLPGPIVLLTTGAILHGTPASPCVAAWDAHAVGRAAISAIIPGDLAHAWLFRAALSAGGSRTAGTFGSIDVRPMACRFDPSVRVPDAVWNEPATSRPVP